MVAISDDQTSMRHTLYQTTHTLLGKNTEKSLPAYGPKQHLYGAVRIYFLIVLRKVTAEPGFQLALLAIIEHCWVISNVSWYQPQLGDDKLEPPLKWFLWLPQQNPNLTHNNTHPWHQLIWASSSGIPFWQQYFSHQGMRQCAGCACTSQSHGAHLCQRRKPTLPRMQQNCYLEILMQCRMAYSQLLSSKW